MKKAAILCLAMSLAGFACQNKPAGEQLPDPMAANLDTTVLPGNDFFSYANGGWFKRNPIPASEQNNGIFQLIQDTVNAQVQAICVNSMNLKNAEKGSPEQKIGDFFASGMDSVALNKKGISDIAPEIKAVDNIKNLSDLMRQTACIQRISNSPLFGFWVSQDERNSSKYQLNLSQGGLGMPDISYYLDKDARSAGIRKAYLEHLEKMYSILGYAPAAAKTTAQKTLAIETAMASRSLPREALRDPIANYHKMPYNQLQKTTPGIDWNAFFGEIGVQHPDTVLVGQPAYLQALEKMLKSYALEDWKNYLKYQLINGLAEYMDDRTYLEDFNFYSKTLRGVEEPKARWKRVVEKTNGSLGELIGQVYVKDYLPRGTKEKMEEIGNAIKTVFAERIQKLDWMSIETRKQALQKLDAIIMKVGYPDHWKDMSSLKVDRSSYVRNVINSNRWEFAYMLGKLGKPVDRTEWGMYPQTYNAYYNPSNNEIVIPGCNIIVPGFEGRMADDAILYAIVGATFGHEITHGFDDQGCKYDASGNLKDWWTKEDNARFRAKTQMIVKQYNEYFVNKEQHINGELTQGENIADLGGVVMSLEAFKKTEQYRKNEKIGGFTPSQRYFLGYSLAWMLQSRPEAIANQVKTDEHSPAKWRVLGPLANLPDFYEAFGVKPEHKMYRKPADRIVIW